MNLESIKLSQLRALTTIAKHGNFSEAALQLGVSQSAVSHAIAVLEAELGVILLSRGRHGATLTPVGERILTYANQMLEGLEAIGKEANLAKGLQGGRVRVSSFRSVATHILPDVIAEFHKRFPGIQVTLLEYRGDDGVEQALREGRADIALTCMPVSSEFEAWELMQDEYIVLFPPTAQIPNPITWDDLVAYPLIMPPSNDYCSILIRSHLTKLGQGINAGYEIQEDSTIVSMVMRGLGATIMARLAAEPLPPKIQVRQLPAPLKRIFHVATLAEGLHSPAVYAFLDTLRDMGKKQISPLKVVKAS
ncbi:MAG TPA: LysR family transcriptional regulator [Trichocoleus sp.]|jgi:DNA-binding transcriptional LysR family regulator